MNDNKNTAAQPLDLDKLEALARAATPGPWELNRHGAVLGGPIMHYSNGSGRNQIAMATGAEWQRAGEKDANATFIAAANPQTILTLIAQARASQPEGATGTTGASIDTPEFRALLDEFAYRASERRAMGGDFGSADAEGEAEAALTDYIDAIIADLRAQLAAKGRGGAQQEPVPEHIVRGIRLYGQYRADNEAISERQFAEVVYEIGRYYRLAAPASAQPDRGAAQELVDLLKAIRPSYGAVGSRDVDVAAQQTRIDRAIELLDRDAASPASQPVAPEVAPSDLAKVGYFIREGAAWVATSSDDPRATILYRKTGAENAAPTTVPDHSEREAANAGGLAISDDDICAFQHAIQQLEWIASGNTPSKNCDLGDGPNKANIRHAMMHADSALKRMKPAYARLLSVFRDDRLNSQSPATIAAGQEAANAKDAVNSLRNQMAYIASYDPDELTGGDTKEGMRAASRLRAIIVRARAAMAAAPSSEKGGDK